MTHIPDEAVQAKRHLIQSYNWSFRSTGIDAIDNILSSIADAAESYHNTSQWEDEGHIDRIQKYADVAAYHISAPCAVEVRKLEWRDNNNDDYWRCDHDENFSINRWWEGELCYFEVGENADDRYHTIDEAKAAAQADFERRILSCVVTKPVDVAAVRE